MNDELLIIIPLNKINELKIEDALNKLNAFSNVLILNYSNNTELIKKIEKDYTILNEVGDNSDIIKYCLDNYKSIKAITIINNLNEADMEDIINVSKVAINSEDSFVIGVKDRSLAKFSNKVYMFLYKTLFNYTLNDAMSPINSFSLKLASRLADINIYQNNMFITLIEENINIIEIDIKTIYNKAKTNDFNIMDFIKNIYNSFFKYFLKIFIPYIIGLILFLMLFYFINYPNDLISLVLLSILSGLVTIIINIVMNFSNIYHHNSIGNNFIYVFKKLLKAFIGGFFIYILYNLLNLNLLLSKVIIDIILTIIFYLIFRNVGFRNEKKN